MKHLYLKIYAAFLAIVAVSALAAILVRLALDSDSANYDNLTHGLAQLVVKTLPSETGPELDRALEDRAIELGLGLVLWGHDGTVQAQTRDAPEEPNEYRAHRLFRHRPQLGVVVPLEDGRQFGAFLKTPPPHGRFLLWLVSFAGVVALGCYPLARGITSRLERLQKAAHAWSTGALSVRAPVRGSDEIAELGMTLNRAAGQIESLLAQQRRVLASASHELRSPLTRLQMAVSLLDSTTPERRAELVQSVEADIEELSSLIGDLLLAARAEHPPSRPLEPVDVRALVQAEAKRLNVPFLAPDETPAIPGDTPLLRSLVRNLLENALRHGGGKEVAISIEDGPGTTTLVVEDRGPGIPIDQAERIFEPFYRPRGHNEGRDRGVGLGLALVQQIAKHHSGKVRYEPRPGGGSRFIVELPNAAASR